MANLVQRRIRGREFIESVSQRDTEMNLLIDYKTA